jgi:hypothetical protein
MERTARIFRRKKDAIQQKMVIFAWWRKTKTNCFLVKPEIVACVLIIFWRLLIAKKITENML